MNEDGPIPRDEWEVVVRNVPLVSVDLVVQFDGSVALGKRTNQPAKGEWFVPGGTLLKNERLQAAVHRVAHEELGIEVSIEQQLGVYEHFYETADVEDAGGKHYVPVAYHVLAEEDELRPDEQHGTLRWFSPPFDDLDLHPYVEAYLSDASVLERSDDSRSTTE